jgi:hypothetical protein
VNKKLAISIPTFNEISLLKKNLEILFPQVQVHSKDVNLHVFDNNSNDDTEKYILELFQNQSNCYYHKNDRNMGIYKNQLKCLTIENCDFKIVLGSDDIMLEDSVSHILNHLNKNFSLLFYNYYSYQNNYKDIDYTYADENNVTFEKGYDLLNYPSVGHFSGFVFNSINIDKYIDILLNKYQDSFFERHRGIIAFLSAYICSLEDKKTLFIGKRCLATLYKKKVSYNSLEHLCIDYLDAHNELLINNISNDNDFSYRKFLVRKMLLKSSLRNLPYLSKEKNYLIKKRLDFYFDDLKYKIFILPIFYFFRIKFFRYLFRKLFNIYIK